MQEPPQARIVGWLRIERRREATIRLVVQLKEPTIEEDGGRLSPRGIEHELRAVLAESLCGAIGELAASVEPGATAAETAARLMAKVRDAMVYELGSTHVHTRADEALADGRGVCQDFAHVLIGVARLHGLPARYVSGYLYDPSRGAEHEASHAWVDVLDPVRGWISLDPTHDREQTDHYVRIGVGRDYADVPPTRGVYKGPGEETLEVSVRIHEPGQA